ncbi:M20 family metallopeptidase [Noviherbaspirillum sp. 17J57-3]|uniref:M20 family metallopeptidase n=1 Tax=Noviherbaspirillum galbum TaxID=2709383 RepID=A0A6B3SZL0_9BURK|nr:M20 family metallopeptidase [Noviherbaspirillum galbum]
MTSEAIALTQTLVRMDTVNPPGNEDQCTVHLSRLLEQAGFTCRFVEFGPRRSTLVARIGGQASKAALGFTGHVDVVPLGAAPWAHDPFGAEIVEGRMYGRGTSDMKSGVAAFVVAAVALAGRIKSGPGLTLIITAGEETGCEGAFHLVQQPDAQAILGQVGALVVGEPTSNQPLVGHKGVLWLEASAAGVTAHGSMPDQGDNAIYKIARAISSLETFEFEEGPHPLMGKPTLNVGTVRGGLNINSVPDAAEVKIDIRTVAGQDHGHVYSCLCGRLGKDLRFKTLIDAASVYTPPDDPWMRQVFAVCQKHFEEPLQPKTVSYFTDAAALLGPLGNPPTVILGPGEPQMAHQTNEYCEVSRIEEAVTIYHELIEAWCC